MLKKGNKEKKRKGRKNWKKKNRKCSKNKKANYRLNINIIEK